MRHYHTVAQVRAAEASAMQQVADGALMQRAAAGLAAACADVLGGVYGRRVLVLVGAGNNGGDALYAGARLADRGAAVTYVRLADRVHEAGWAAVRRAGGREAGVTDAAAATYDLILDGIVGIGGQPGLREPAATLVSRLGGAGGFVVAVDTPSGLDADSGELPDGRHVRADLTVTFGTYRRCHVLDPAASACGHVALVDIGLDAHLGPAAVQALQPTDVASLLPRPHRDDHKYTRGVLGIRAGSQRYPGAGLLVTRAAHAAGLAGMIRYAGGSAELIRGQLPEVVYGRGRVQALAVGSGLDRDARDAVQEAQGTGLPVVLDADALGHLDGPTTAPAVLTPHSGELARMLGAERGEVESDLLTHAGRAADRWQAVVLLKGPRTVIAHPDGRARVNPTGTPWLATAGSGDVLTGVVGVLLASGLAPFDAASVGAWWHGAAGTYAASARQGSRPIAAGDVITALPAVYAALGAST